MTNVLNVRQLGPVSVLELNRPDRLHAINAELSNAIAETLDAVEQNEEIRAVVITGSGEKSFCAGQDMLEATGVESGSSESGTSSAYRAVERLQASKLPLIAAINGYCFGGGALLAIACDIRLAVNHASFRLPGAEYGLVVGAATIPRLIGAARAKELIFTARKFSADEALSWGLVNHLYEAGEVLDAAIEMAEKIAANSATAVQQSKRIIDAASLDHEVIADENRVNAELRASDEHAGRFRQATTRVTGR